MEPRRLSIALLLAALFVMPGIAVAAGTISGTVSATPAKYLPDTVVHLVKAPSTHKPTTATMDQKNKTFIPHVLAITAGDTVKFLNSDTIQHNVYSPDCNYNLGVWGPGDSRTHTFSKAGVCTQLCSLHPEMLAYIFVGQNPYHAVVDKQGNFKIENVPPGTYRIAVWNSKLKAADQSVTVRDGQTAQVKFSLAR